MTSIHNIQQKFVEELSEFYEALYAAQECLEEDGALFNIGSSSAADGSEKAGMSDYEPRTS